MGDWRSGHGPARNDVHDPERNSSAGLGRGQPNPRQARSQSGLNRGTSHYFTCSPNAPPRTTAMASFALAGPRITDVENDGPVPPGTFADVAFHFDPCSEGGFSPVA